MHDRSRQNEGRAKNKGDDQAAYQMILDPACIAAAMRLRHQPGGAHSRKPRPK